MTDAEKKTALTAHANELMMWKVLVAIMGINLAWGLYSVIKYFINNGDAVSTPFLGSFLIGFILLGLGLNAWITWGVYKIERWVTLWMWINLVLSILSFNVISVIISVAVLVVYKKILKVVYPATPAAPVPPVAPTQA